jgi:hypothetical protein
LYTVNAFVHVLRVRRLAALALVLLCVMAAPPRANGLPAGPSPARVGASPGTTGQTSVQGVAWRVEATAVANETGQFTFTRIEGGTYVVELLGENGKIVSVGHAFVIAQGETVATFVRLGTKVPWFSGFFGNLASAVASSAATQGITALAPVQLTESR